MAPEELYKEWLKKAEEDFGFACITLADPAITYYAQICFHFQQAAEKYLKAYIVAHELEFKKIHDLTELLRICSNHLANLNKLNDACAFLTDFYIDTRYPVHWPSNISKNEALQAESEARKIKDTIIQAIGL